MQDKFTLIDNIPDEEPARQYYFISHLKDIVSQKAKEKGRALRACVTTMGCQMNARDSEKIWGILLDCGYEESSDEDADLIIFNTCTVRENANEKLYGHLGQVKSKKKKNPDMIVAICGCMMQELDEVERVKKSYSFVDIVFGTHNIYKFAELLFMHLTSHTKVYDVIESADKIVEDLPKKRKFDFKSGVNITFGCDNFCSYCIVPYVRGRERSRNSIDIIHEIEELVADGVVEIMLLGQNVNSYGKGLDEDMDFPELLDRVASINGLKRLRFMTSHPKDLSDKLIDVIAKHKNICHHIHLPLQSGSTRVLQEMNRHYTKEDYLELTKKIYEKIPDISITTDIMVGFPGESEEDFEDTLDVIEKVGFSSAFTFIYSKRTGTKAATMENQVPEMVVKKRFDRLLEALKKTSDRYAKRDVGSIRDVLVETENSSMEGYLSGRLENNMLVHFKGNARLIGNIVSVKLLETKGFYYIGEVI